MLKKTVGKNLKILKSKFSANARTRDVLVY